MSEHPDDLAVDRLARAMKRKLKKAREAGRYGWNDEMECDVDYLASLLVLQLTTAKKADPVDIANFAMMLYNRKGGKTALRRQKVVLL